jgi:hypothetical protein
VRMTWKKPIMHRHSLLEYNYGNQGLGMDLSSPNTFFSAY